MTRLIYLPANGAWTFLFGDALLALDGWPHFYPTKNDAIAAARSMGLVIGKGGAFVAAGHE